jgi:hypothetical protein
MFIIIILTANGDLSGGNGITIRHDTQVTHHAQEQNTAHKAAHTIKDTLHTKKAMQMNRPPLTSRNIPDTHLRQGLSRPMSHSAVGHDQVS